VAAVQKRQLSSALLHLLYPRLPSTSDLA
jgi:hypothetical protein